MSGQRSTSAAKGQTDDDLAETLGGYSVDPLGFVYWAFPWGEPDTELADESGPDAWQIDVLQQVGDGLSPDAALRIAVASGHGVGKSGLVAWLILWAISTCVDTKGVVTANTGTQLATKTWSELSKWHRLYVARHKFVLTATALHSADQEHEKNWRVDAIVWSERNTEAFAGLHNKGKRVLCLMDEASAIPDVIFETTEGALTDANTEIIWACFGNPTRNTGRFRECWGRFRNRWLRRQVDSRTAKLANKAQIAEWVNDYGEDSDFVRVRVRGEFPRAGSLQFIPSDLVDAAMSEDRQVEATVFDPLIMGVDVARFGDDQSVIRLRRGRDARTIPPVKLRGVDTVQLAHRIAEQYMAHRPDAIFVDEGGVGGGVVDHLRFLRLPVVGVQFGAKPQRGVRTAEGAVAAANHRAEMWLAMRDWLRGGMLDLDPEMVIDLTGVEYGYRMIEGVDCVQLEKKEDMKKRGLASPDNADALALTFALPVQPSDHTAAIVDAAMGRRSGVESDYNPYAEAWRAGGLGNAGQSGPQGWMPGRESPFGRR